jgi:outer membrane protein W
MRPYPLTILLALTAGPATAQEAGYYAKLFGGASSLQGSSVDLGGTSQPLSYGSGAIYGGAFGYDYGDRPFRSELEFAYRSSDGTGAVSGDFASTTLMLNGYYVFSRGAFTPYAGFGLGYVTEIDFDVTSGPGIGGYSDRGLFAWQAVLGADYAIADQASLFGELRYFATEAPSLTSAGGATLKADYDTIDILAGVSFRF